LGFSIVLFALLGLALSLPFEVHIKSVQDKLDGDSPSYSVAFSLTNTAPHSAIVCKWGTPLDDSTQVLKADMFEAIHDSGVRARYTGIVMKRIPTADDFIVLAAGETMHMKIDLLKGYWFPKIGHYYVSLSSYIYVYGGELKLAEIVKSGLTEFTQYNLISSEALDLEVEGLAAEPYWGAEPYLRTVTPLANCPTNNVTTIRSADTNAGTLISRVNSYLSNSCNNATTSSYVVWMGTCDANRYSTVKSHFSAIGSRQSAGYRVDCAGSSCQANIYAYVYPTDTTFTVYVCGAFWSASLNTCAFDSKPGTLIHELSHFNAVAGTSDYAYGQTACKDLAKSNPARAISNADNHEYLAEQCP